MEPTETMEVPPLEAGAEKKGRGPTRPEVKFADLVQELKGDAVILDALRSGDSAQSWRAASKAQRTAAKEAEKQAMRCDSTAETLARVEELPEALRRALVVVLTPEAK